MLSAVDITKGYKKSRRVIDKFTYRIKEGSFEAVMGESGSGKSTLLAILAGLLKPDEGTVTYRGKNLYNIDENQYLRIRRNDIGYIPQSNALIKTYTVLENILFPHLLVSEESTEEILRTKAEEYLHKLGIYQLKDNYPYEISGGEAKRVSIVRAMVVDPDIVIADEPTTGLDKNTAKLILDYLYEYASKGKSVVVATHDEQVREYATNIITLDRGAQV